VVEHYTYKSEAAVNGEAPLNPNDSILYMEEKINPQDPVQSATDSVRKAAESLHASAEAKAEQFQDAAENAWSDALSRAKTWQAEVESYVRQNPTKAVLMALGFGFVLSRRLWK
jgi:ElaB/YqjD/DUF883 family membrane-anchored ribosome-binding protein